MQVTLAQMAKVKGDRVLVRRVKGGAEMIGSIVVPESIRDKKPKYREAWRAVAVDFGDKVDLTEFNKFGDLVQKGTMLILAPECIDCPHFNSKDEAGVEHTYYFVREEDIIGVETQVPA